MTATIDLTLTRAHWLTPDLLAYPPCALGELDAADLDWTFHAAPDGGIDPHAPEPVAWQTIPLTREPGLPPEVIAEFPHLSRAVALRLPAGLDARELLRGQVVVAAYRHSGSLGDASGVQIGGVLDRLYPDAVKARLGITWSRPDATGGSDGGTSWRDGKTPTPAASAPTLRVWAPTARRVDLLLWTAAAAPTDAPARLPMALASDGTWSITGEPNWRDARYQYAVTVFAPSFGRVVENRVTDPYSVALTVNSTRSVIADLDDQALRPKEWERTPSPPLGHAVDQVIYELHVRDFSRSDDAVAPELRGRYLAFTADGHGRRHLARLASAGLNTVQLLPIFDYASVEEDAGRQDHPDKAALRAARPHSDDQQEAVRTPRPSFNWGYDPWHYQVPEGSFATDDAVNGAGRTTEVRAMIGALHAMGLRVVLDQVYNHTNGSGQGTTSVLGRIVPVYYHRHDRSGEVSHSTCCPGVATEHAMAEKLMVESVVHWVRAYRVDGFRFDLMGHHSRATMLKVRAALDELTLAADGVDGSAVTLYGEGWNFGEVADNARFVQATQGQLGGTGIGTFSDRLRDAVRGGAPFDADPRAQGFGTGVVSVPNGARINGDEAARGRQLLRDADLIQLGLAGNLRAFRFRSQLYGDVLAGDDLPYGTSVAGYAQEPDEVISYVDAHDNETLFDAITMKVPADVPMAQRVRINTVCLAMATLGQSPVMWHAGSDFLRSKSLDRNSFDSGDWFNYLDFTLTDNGFGAGLPPASDNASHWRFMRPLLADPALKPSPADMRAAHEAACDLLRLRASSRLFRLRTAAQIAAKVSFPVSGTWAQASGVIVMLLNDRAGDPVDAQWGAVAVAVNANAWPVRQEVPRLRSGGWRLHPVQASGADPVVQRARCDDGVLFLPAWTCAVFVDPRDR